MTPTTTPTAADELSFVFIQRGDGSGAEIVTGGHTALREHYLKSIWCGGRDDLPEEIVHEADIIGDPDHEDWDDWCELSSIADALFTFGDLRAAASILQKRDPNHDR